MIVVDAPVAVKWFVPEPGRQEALTLLGSNERTIAPDLVIAETMHALRKKLRAGDMIEEQFKAAAADLPSYFDDIVSSASVAPEAARLSVLLDHGFYDCVYLALAITPGATLVTSDEVLEAKVSAAGWWGAIRKLADGSSGLDADPLEMPRHTVESIARLSAIIGETCKALRDVHKTDDRFRFYPVSIYRPAFDSPAYVHLRQLLLGLTSEERAQVIALAWLGRDHERGSFQLLVENARRLFSEHAEQDLAYIISVTGTVQAGYEKLLRLSDAQSSRE